MYFPNTKTSSKNFDAKSLAHYECLTLNMQFSHKNSSLHQNPTINYSLLDLITHDRCYLIQNKAEIKLRANEFAVKFS